MISKGMTHEQAREALEALALDALDASERAVVLAHLRGCAECQAELAVLERTAAELTIVAQPLAMSSAQRDRVRSRLLARAAADSASRSGGSSASTSSRDARVVSISDAPSARASVARRGMGASGWSAIAAGIIAVASVVLLGQTRNERDALRESLRVAAAEQGSRRVALDSLRAAVDDKDRLIANLTGRDVAVMTLASTDPTSPTGRMFWDQAHNAWVFVAHNLQAPKPGRAYQLWLVTPTQKISAGTFSPSATGDAVVRATYALDKNSLAAIAVTEEPEAGSAQPTTTPFLVATSQ